MKLQDLKRGMRCTTMGGYTFIVGEVKGSHIEFLEKASNDLDIVGAVLPDLTNYFEDDWIVKVEDITQRGYKVIWERKDPKKYYLRIPNYWLFSRNFLNYNTVDKSYWFGAVDEGSCWKVEFTQEEIDNLPNQDFIKTLIKEEVQ